MACSVLGHEYTAVCETGMVPAFTEMTIHEGDRRDMNTPETNVPPRAIIATKAMNIRNKCGKVVFHWEVRGGSSEKMTCKVRSGGREG